MNDICRFLGPNDFDRVLLTDSFEISGISSDNTYPFRMFSGAQKASAALALRIALSKIKQDTETGTQGLGLILLDEPSANFDGTRSKNFKELMHKLTKMFPQVLCTTHDEKLMNPEQNIYVSMENKCSAVQGY